MALFQKSVLNKFIKSQDTVKIEAAYQRFSDNFQKAERQAEIRSMKEEEYQDGFLDDLFVNILGYIKRPNAGFNLVREKKNEADSKKADGAILKNEMPLAVIELKGTDTTDLDKVTNQGFGYKNNHKECVYVVVSNFEKLRFYIHHAVDYIEFNLFTLSKEDFTTLWLCLHSDNLLDNIPAKIKAESVVKEEDITKNLYKDYSSFKQELWQSIVNLNPEGDPLMFYKKTQKLIDRFLFIFFAEDAGLLPPNSITRMVDRWQMLKDEDAYKPLYDIFKQYFGYINTGRSGKTPQDEIFAYNGGLFVEDKILDEILVNDDVLLKHTLKLTVYDFSSEVDVNILGHIFENSLNDIEAVTAELEGKEIDKSKTKRKKDGVFYTPKYITKYIVDNTVGKLCDEKKVELNIIDEEYAKGRTNRKKETLKQLDENLQAYRNWLLNITICDPACGSGAFLNQALEYLMEEHRYIDELESQLLGAGFTFPGVENHILENNIFGVDINDESIEIAKLSLWLRTAQRGRKLTSLNNNIKCGNSLIDDTNVAGAKAFSWEKEFPTVFEKGGFDVIIGNPPYGVNFNEVEKRYLSTFDKSVPDYEIYIYFISLYRKILKINSVLSYIFPNTFLSTVFGKKYRDELLSNISVYQIVDLSNDNTFVDASVRTCIFSFRNKKDEFDAEFIKPNNESFDLFNKYTKTELLLNSDNLMSLFNQNNEEKLLISKIQNNSILKDFYQVSQGFIPYRRSDLIKKYGEEEGNKIVDEKQWHSSEKKNDEWRKEIFGKEINRYSYNNIETEFIYYGKHVASYVDPKFFSQERILVREITADKLFCMYITEELYNNPSLINIIDARNILSLKYSLAILNSKLIGWLHNKISPKANKGLFPKILINDVRNIPLIEIDKNAQKIFISKSDLMLQLNKDLQEQTRKFLSLLQSDFKLEKPSKKIEEFYTLTWSEFEKELSKNKITLLGVSKDDWFDRFDRFKKLALELKTQIDQTDKEIDRMVYELYGLTQEEIQIVENN
jgi:type I restriction-modification system DNA methylase subunit